MTDAAESKGRVDPAAVLVYLDGGPFDGRTRMVDAATAALRLAAAKDGSVHVYERVHTERILPDGRRAVILRWRGPC